MSKKNSKIQQVYIISINGNLYGDAFESLKDACTHAQVGYSAAKEGKTHWLKGSTHITITRVSVVPNVKNPKGNKDNLI